MERKEEGAQCQADSHKKQCQLESSWRIYCSSHFD